MNIWDFLVPAGIGLGTAYIAANASGNAARTAAGAADRSAEAQLAMFQQNREDMAPYREAGGRGLSRFEGSLGPSFQESPGYQFAFDEGRRAIDQNASARGMLNSGSRLQALTRYGQGMANQEFGNYQNRLAALSGIGQSATGQTAQMGQQTAANMGQAYMQGGQAAAQGQIGQANAILGGVNQGIGLYGLMNPGWGSVK